MAATGYDFTTEALRFQKCFTEKDNDATTVTLLAKGDYDGWMAQQAAPVQGWLNSIGHAKHKGGRLSMLPAFSGTDSAGGALGAAAFCLEEDAGSPFALCSLFDSLPPGKYKLASAEGGAVSSPNAAALSWALATYKLKRYKSATAAPSTDEGEPSLVASAAAPEKVLVWPGGADQATVTATAASTFLVRDLISTPCEDMGPPHLQAVAEALAAEFGATTTAVVGETLLEQNWPQLHAVGRAAGAGREPRIIDLRWGSTEHPKVTLVGKGVCFDTGGLDIKPSSAMLTMKKDMGGGAQVLGLARMIMAAKVPVRMRVLVPAVENNIAGNAFRPGDILTARNGKTTEIGNTDAEGRLVLADALVEACSESPELLVDMATLTGAARVALGTDVPVVFCNDDEVATRLTTLSGGVHDQVWRLPLWEGYRKQIESPIADLKNVGASYGGAITAALYLDEFVSAPAPGGKKPKWVHMDFMAFNQASRPGRPEGGEAQGMRAAFALVADMFG